MDFDLKIRLVRISGMQIISLSSALIFALTLSVELYSEYLITMLYYGFSMIFVPSLYLASKQISDQLYKLNAGNMFGLMAFVCLCMYLASSYFHYFDIQCMVQAQIYVVLTYTSSELFLVSRKNSSVTKYCAISILLATPPLIAAISLFLMKFDAVEALIWVQLGALFSITVTMLIMLHKDHNVAIVWKIPSWNRKLIFEKNFLLAILFTLASNAAGYLFQYTMRNFFVALSLQNGDNFYNFILGVLQRLHTVYDSVSERYFHNENQLIPKLFNTFDLTLFLLLSAGYLIGAWFTLNGVVILAATCLIFLIQAVSAQHHHFLLGKQRLLVLFLIYSFVGLGLYLLDYSDIESISLSLICVFLLYNVTFLGLASASRYRG